MNIIVTADENWAIGRGGRPLVEIPAERRLFRQETAGKTLVVGRKTLQSFPGGKPPGHCETIVLTADPSFKVRGALTVSSVEELLSMLEGRDTGDIYVAGGESVFNALLPYCDTVHVTKIDYAYAADAHFPDLDSDPDFEITADSDEQTYFDLTYHFLRYQRKRDI